MRLTAILLAWTAAAALLPAADSALSGFPSSSGLLDPSLTQETRASLDRGLAWLVSQRRPEGGWDGADRPDLTALPLLALAGSPNPAHEKVRRQGLDWLIRSATNGSPSVILFSILALTRESAERPDLKPLLRDLRDRLAASPLPDEPRLLALRLLAFQSLPDPPPATLITQCLGRIEVNSGSAASAVLLGFQAARAPRNDPVMWKAFHWIAHHREAVSPTLTTPEAYEDILVLALALAQSGESRLPLPDRSLLAWRPMIASSLINRQQVDPVTGTLFWSVPAGKADSPSLAVTCHALLALQVVLAE